MWRRCARIAELILSRVERRCLTEKWDLVAVKYKTLLAVLLFCVNKIKGMITVLKWMPFCKSVLEDCKKIVFFFLILYFDIEVCLLSIR